MTLKDGSVRAPVWRPTRQTKVSIPNFCVMHGGPLGMHLPEHEHPDLQIETHFHSESVRPNLQGCGRIARYSLLLPSGKPHIGQWKDGSEVIVCLLSREMLERSADALSTGGSRDVADIAYTDDGLLRSMASVLRQEFLQRTWLDPLFAESIGIVMSGHIVRQFSRRTGPYSIRGRLSAAQLRQTIECIDDRLTARLRIEELAELLGMNSHRFTRYFAAAMGQTPYQFVLNRKIERAKTFLTRTDMSIAQIALELNFCSQGHFTTIFRQKTTLTPLAFRERIR